MNNDLAKIAELERHHEDAVNVVYQAACKVAEIARSLDCERGSLFEDLDAIEKRIKELETENAALKRDIGILETETVYCSVEHVMELEAKIEALRSAGTRALEDYASGGYTPLSVNEKFASEGD